MPICNISVIFLCHNNPHIRLCVSAAHSMLQEGDEIIVVDDNSNEKMQEILERLRSDGKITTLLNSVQKGNRASNRNLGARAAVNDILLFMDGDMVLCPKALQALRTAHAKGGAIAYVGPKHNIRYADVHSSLYNGISTEHYIGLLQTESGRTQLMDNPLFTDTCLEDFKNIDLGEYFWLHFYAGACSLGKNVFEAVGGFDENFTTWGGEDIDLGYRVSKKGMIGFIKQFSSIHIPHPKDVIQQEISANENMLRMVKKYGCWEFEVLYAFSSELEVFNSFFKIINQMRMINTTPLGVVLFPNTMAVYPISSKHPNGLVICCDEDGEYRKESLSLALDFLDRQIDTVYVADTVFIYPSIVASRILQELCRVSKRVLIMPTGETIRIDWKGISYSALGRSNSRLLCRSSNIMDFRFNRKRDGTIEVESIMGNNNVVNYERKRIDVVTATS